MISNSALFQNEYPTTVNNVLLRTTPVKRSVLLKNEFVSHRSKTFSNEYQTTSFWYS